MYVLVLAYIYYVRRQSTNCNQFLVWLEASSLVPVMVYYNLLKFWSVCFDRVGVC